MTQKTLTITDDNARKTALAKMRANLKTPVDNVPAYLNKIAPKKEAPRIHRQSVRLQKEEAVELTDTERKSLSTSFRDLRNADNELVQLEESVLATGDLLDRSSKKEDEDEIAEIEAEEKTVEEELEEEIEEVEEEKPRISPAKVKKDSTADLHRLNRKKGETSESALNALLENVRKQNELTEQMHDKIERQEYDKQVGVFYNDLQRVNSVIPQLEQQRDQMNFEKMRAINNGDQAKYLHFERLHNETKAQLEQAYEIRANIANSHKEFNTQYEQKIAAKAPQKQEPVVDADEWGFTPADHQLINEGAELWAMRHPDIDVDIETGEGRNEKGKKAVQIWQKLVQEGEDPRKLKSFYNKLEERLAAEFEAPVKAKETAPKAKKPVVSGGAEAPSAYSEGGIPAEVRISELPTMVQKMYRNLKTPNAQKSFLREYFSKQKR